MRVLTVRAGRCDGLQAHRADSWGLEKPAWTGVSSALHHQLASDASVLVGSGRLASWAATTNLAVVDRRKTLMREMRRKARASKHASERDIETDRE